MTGARKYEVLAAIRQFVKTNEMMPTVRDVMKLTGIRSTSTVIYNLKALEQDGYLKRHKKFLSRAMVLTEKGKATYVPTHTSIIRKHKKSGETTKAQAGTLGRGGNAFVPRVANSEEKIAENIEKVVRAARRKGTILSGQVDVIRNAPVRLSNATKIG